MIKNLLNSSSVNPLGTILLEAKVEIISFVGFTKKTRLKKLSKIFINLNTKNYGISEDAFQSFMHIISQIIRIESSNKKIKML